MCAFEGGDYAFQGGKRSECVERLVIVFFIFIAPFLVAHPFFFSSRRRHTRSDRDWSSDVCSSDLMLQDERVGLPVLAQGLDDVEVSEQEQRLPAAVASEACDQHALLGEGLEDLRLRA